MRSRARGGAALLLALLAWLPAHAGTIDPRLAALPRSSATPVRAWVEFRDKGASGAELDRLLAQAAARLTPRARARRERAHVTPLVDAYDLPVASAYLDALTRGGFQPHAVSRWLNRAAVWVAPARLRELAALPCVARVSPVVRTRVDRGPEGGFVPALPRPADRFDASRTLTVDHGLLQTVLAQIGVPAVHDSGYVGAGVLIAILDDGFTGHESHEALSGVPLAPGRQRDFVTGDTVLTYPGSFFQRHGTLVMGCLAGNLPGTYVGSAPGADYALARTEIDSLEVRAELLNWARAAEWADSLGADLISTSLGYSTFDDPDSDFAYADMNGHTTPISRAAEIAASKGILVVAAAGNSGQQSWHYIVAPADVNGDSLIAVGAVDSQGTPAGFSSYGPSADGRIKPDLAGPGVSVPVVSTSNSSGYGSDSGTSLSTPLVAGLAACILGARPGWTPQQVIDALERSASQGQRPDNRVGYGIPDGLRTLQGATASPPGPRHRLELVRDGRNPFHSGDATGVAFTLAAGTPPRAARVRVYDLRGGAVRTLWTGTLNPGVAAHASWDGTDEGRHALAAGVYWIAIDAGGEVAAARVVWLR